MEIALDMLCSKHDTFIRELYRRGAANMQFSLERDILVIRCDEEPFDLEATGFNRYTLIEIVIPTGVRVELMPHPSCDPREMEANCRAFILKHHSYSDRPAPGARVNRPIR